MAAGLQLVLIYMGRVDTWELIFSLDACLLGGVGRFLGFFLRLRLMTKCARTNIKSESLVSIILCQFSSASDSCFYLNSGYRRPCEFLKENCIETM